MAHYSMSNTYEAYNKVSPYLKVPCDVVANSGPKSKRIHSDDEPALDGVAGLRYPLRSGVQDCVRRVCPQEGDMLGICDVWRSSLRKLMGRPSQCWDVSAQKRDEFVGGLSTLEYRAVKPNLLRSFESKVLIIERPNLSLVHHVRISTEPKTDKMRWIYQTHRGLRIYVRRAKAWRMDQYRRWQKVQTICLCEWKGFEESRVINMWGESKMPCRGLEVAWVRGEEKHGTAFSMYQG